MKFLVKFIVILGILWYNIKVLEIEILGGLYMSNEENYIIENEKELYDIDYQSDLQKLIKEEEYD